MMEFDLLSDYPLRGYTFENMARIILRRMRHNNFIFCCKHFDDIAEILSKYRLNIAGCKDKIDAIREKGLKSDLIEFRLKDIIGREIEGINFYDVKSRIFNSQRPYHEMCLSDYKFMQYMKKIGCGTFIISIMMLRDWRFSYEITGLDDEHMRVYDSSIKETVKFT